VNKGEKGEIGEKAGRIEKETVKKHSKRKGVKMEGG